MGVIRWDVGLLAVIVLRRHPLVHWSVYPTTRTPSNCILQHRKRIMALAQQMHKTVQQQREGAVTQKCWREKHPRTFGSFGHSKGLLYH